MFSSGMIWQLSLCSVCSCLLGLAGVRQVGVMFGVMCFGSYGWGEVCCCRVLYVWLSSA